MLRRPILLAAAALGAAVLALPAPTLACGPGKGHGDPELAKARRTLMAATIVAKLQLTKEQKAALKKILVEARRLRDEAREGPAAKARRAKARRLLEKATAEVRRSGEISPDTRAALAALRADGAAQRSERHQTMRELMRSARDVLTPEQRQRLHELRPPMGPAKGEAGPRGQMGMGGPGMGPPPGRMGGPGMGPPPGAMGPGRRGPGMGGPGMHGPGHHRKKMLMHLLLSDEFLAELDR